MPLRRLALSVVFIAFAVALGWYARGVERPVHAESAAPPADELGFQFGGTKLEGSLTLYSPASHTLYVYPANSGGSSINCAYMIHVEKPGAPIRLSSCRIGETP